MRCRTPCRLRTTTGSSTSSTTSCLISVGPSSEGGEPFLAPENKRVWDELIRIGYRGETTITTNGTLWNDEVEHYFRALRAEPNISVDGMTAEVLEPICVGVDAAKLWANIDRAQSIAEEVGSTLTLSYCLMTTNWHELPDFLTEVDRRGVSCYIILVNQPHRYDVLRLTHRELVDIVESLDRRRPVFTHARPESEWERIMRRLRSQIEHPVELNVVVVPPPDRARSEPEPAPPAPPPVPVDEPALRRAIAAVSTLDPIDVEVFDGTVVSATTPPWASALAPGRWVGSADANLPSLVGSIVGAQPAVELAEKTVRRVDEFVIRFGIPGDEMCVRVFVVPNDGGHRGFRWLIVPTRWRPAIELDRPPTRERRPSRPGPEAERAHVDRAGRRRRRDRVVEGRSAPAAGHVLVGDEARTAYEALGAARGSAPCSEC